MAAARTNAPGVGLGSRLRNVAQGAICKPGLGGGGGGLNGLSSWPAFSDPSKQGSKFYDDCAKTNDPLGNGMQADHAIEVQLGGSVKGPFIWLDGAVNGASGRQIKSARAAGNTNPSGFTTKNC